MAQARANQADPATALLMKRGRRSAPNPRRRPVAKSGHGVTNISAEARLAIVCVMTISLECRVERARRHLIHTDALFAGKMPGF
jgi:hypothetical protein